LVRAKRAPAVGAEGACPGTSRFCGGGYSAGRTSLANSGTLATVDERRGHENFSMTADLYNKCAPLVDEAIAHAVGDAIFAPEVDNGERLCRAEG
jgi:hypothetical protein